MDRSQVLAVLDQLRQGLTADDVESETLEIKPWPGRVVDERFIIDRERLAGWLREYAVCFTNTRGGMLLFGIRERIAGAAAIQGCESYDLDEMKRMVFEGTIPGITVDIDELVLPEGCPGGTGAEEPIRPCHLKRQEVAPVGKDVPGVNSRGGYRC